MALLEAVAIPVAHGALEGLLRYEDTTTTPEWAAVICHPHPQAGGTMHNKVVATAAKALNAAGMPAVRFNFRGVGRSTGRFGDGIGEADDARAALDWLAARYPGAHLLLAGFSFGAWVGLPVGAADERVTRLIGLGVPVAALPVSDLAGAAAKLIVQGAADDYGPEPALRAWFARMAPPKDLVIVPGASHFFDGHLDDLAGAITAWAAH